MRVGIVGSRRRRDWRAVFNLVDKLPSGTVVISGGCKRSVDTWAVLRARERGLETVEHLPKLSRGMSYWQVVQAMYARNRLIAEDCDILVAFVAPDRTGGTENTIGWAKKLGKKVCIR
jgi:predicted Rossmann fold nucleotide-binding protein DprA/Smf involved in DNA uptake